MRQTQLFYVMACGLLCTTAIGAEPLANFDIRLSHEKADVQALEQMRAQQPAARSRDVQLRSDSIAARTALAKRLPNLIVEIAAETGGVEGLRTKHGPQALSSSGPQLPAQAARGFLRQHAALYGLSESETNALSLDADYANPAGNLQWVRFTQQVNDLPVFRGEVTLALNALGEVIRTTGQLASGFDAAEAKLHPDVDAASALQRAAHSLGVAPAFSRVAPDHSTGTPTFLWTGLEFPVKAELLYFPLGSGALELAWSTMVPDGTDVYQMIVSATDGTVLYRQNLTNYVAFNYRVYPTDSPAPFSPGPTNPTLGAQGTRISSSLLSIESLVTSGPTASHPWLVPGAIDASGNNARAGVDLVAPDGIDVNVAVSSPGSFDYSSNPPPGSPAPGDDPTTAASRNAAAVNAFYWANRFHDALYDLGFTEPARNFQNDNYGRGGLGGDSISMQIQDSSGTNNANSTFPADGGASRMQSYVWTGPLPSRDGALDASIMLHELAHGVSRRLHGNAAGLATGLGGSLGEGWSDFYAAALLSEPGDSLTGTYPVGAYATYLLTGGFNSNYYYGIRRFPLAILAAIGGPGNQPFNPLTFADIDATQFNVANAAYVPGSVAPAGAEQLHNASEVWSTALWETRAKLVQSHGAVAGNQRMLQIVTDGMKLDVLNPDFLTARDSIVAATCATYPGADEIGVWEGFASRGMGFSASITSIAPNRVVEAFDTPGAAITQLDVSSQTCAAPDYSPGPGETMLVQFRISNGYCSNSVSGVTASIVGGGSVSVGSLAGGDSIDVSIPFTIPVDQACGTTIPLTLQVDSSLGTQNVDFSIDVGTTLQSFEFSSAGAVQVPAVPTSSGPASPYPSNVVVSGVTQPVTGIALHFDNLVHTFPDDIDMLLVAPSGQRMVVMSDVGGSADINLSFSLDDAAVVALPDSAQLVDGQVYRPANYGAGDAFVGAPAGPHPEAAPAGAATFADFAGIDPNGVWGLYIVDDVGSDLGTLAGWTLRIDTQITPQCLACTLTFDIFADGFED